MEEKTALITGAASGIGKATALLLAREGARVAVTDLHPDQGQLVVEEIQRQGGTAVFISLDVTREADWAAAMAMVEREFSNLNVLVNNAGAMLPKNLEDTTLSEWQQLMTVNLDSVILGTKHGLKALRKTGGGAIVNVSSVSGLSGHPLWAAYSASKGGVTLLTKSTALYCTKNKLNIRVNSVHPGAVDTAVGRSFFTEQETIRWLKPEDIAQAILFLAGDDAAFITGSSLVMDGGQHKP